MITKSRAKTFFLVGTLSCSTAFLLLTFATLRRIPLQTHGDKLDDVSVRGKRLWDKSNCMGCHTLLGEGGYYAPELTKVSERRGDVFVGHVIKDPEKMFPGQRKMVKYDFTDFQISGLVKFLSWVGEIDTNGFPAAPKKGLGNIQSGGGKKNMKSTNEVAQPEKMAICLGCHQLNGSGGVVGPSFDSLNFGEGNLTEEALKIWLKDPQSVKPGTAMPNLGLNDNEVSEITTFLLSTKGGNK